MDKLAYLAYLRDEGRTPRGKAHATSVMPLIKRNQGVGAALTLMDPMETS